ARGALDGGVRNSSREAAILGPRQMGGRRGTAPGGELGLVSRLRELVPRTHGEAIVAAVDTVAHERTQLTGDRPLVLDRQVRNAAPCIEPIGCRKRRGRADIEASAAIAAVVGFCGISRQIERSENRPEE